MAGIKRGNRIRRALGVVVLAGSLAIGVTTILTSTHASAAVGVPHKVCSSPASDGIPDPGTQVTCAVSLLGAVTAGETVEIAPTAPSGATIASCMGLTILTPSPYVTTVSGTCKFVIFSGASAGDVLLGTEVLNIPSSTAPNTSVTQTAQICETTLGCFPATPMGVTGGGSCVGGAALPIGGCAPTAPSSSPPTSPPTSGCLPSPLNSFCIPPATPSSSPTCLPSPLNSFCIPPATPSNSPTCLPSPLNTFCIPPGSPPSCLPIPGLPPPLGCPATSSSPGTTSPGGVNGGGGNNGGGGGNGTGQSQAGQVAGTTATSTPFTGGPPHPLPILGFTIVGLGLLISGFTFWPGARRRLRLRVERTKNNW
jgi:hypothetical protein